MCHICVIHTEASGPQILDGNAYFFGVHFFQQEMEGSSLDTSHYSLSREGHLGNPLALTLSYYMNIGVGAAYAGLVPECVKKRSAIIAFYCTLEDHFKDMSVYYRTPDFDL